MELQVIDLFGSKKATAKVDASVFGCEVREDIISQVIRWQLAKRQAGTHKTKERGEVSGTTKKPFKQKGTGNARQGSKKGPHFRGGGVAFGPVVRSHAFDMPKKIRALGLRSALSQKAKEGNLFVVDSLTIDSTKTKDFVSEIAKKGWNSVLFVDADKINDTFARAISNLYKVDALPEIGSNVYDILKRQVLVITKPAIEKLEARLK